MKIDDGFFNIFRVYARKLEHKIFGSVTLRSKTGSRGWVLLSYVTHPFVITHSELIRSPHTNPWECLILSQILLERGFNIDIIDWQNTSFIPQKKYAIVIDVNQNLERFAEKVPKECIKIFYITGAHWRYQNEAEQKRLREIKERRGCILETRRQMNSSNNIENADYATSLGNGFAKETYAFAMKSITQIPLLSNIQFSSPEGKDFEHARNNFVWIGGGGAAHKGLDLVLECFAKMPNYNLSICAPVASEKDFTMCYHKELYETKNIKLIGRIDLHGKKFEEIIKNSVGLIYASCSEGQSGSVLAGLHAGLIPIVNRESGVDVEPFGISLTSSSIQEIRDAIIYISTLPNEELQRRSLASWDYARKNHTSENFSMHYARFIDEVLTKIKK